MSKFKITSAVIGVLMLAGTNSAMAQEGDDLYSEIAAACAVSVASCTGALESLGDAGMSAQVAGVAMDVIARSPNASEADFVSIASTVTRIAVRSGSVTRAASVARSVQRSTAVAVAAGRSPVITNSVRTAVLTVISEEVSSGRAPQAIAVAVATGTGASPS